MLTVSTYGAFQRLACFHDKHGVVIEAFWLGERYSACVEAWNACFGVAAEVWKMGFVRHFTIAHTTARFPMQPNWSALLPATWTIHYIFFFMGVLAGTEVRAPSMS
jgi:hypothetical protein